LSFEPLVLPAGEFSAYLFDLDGTVAERMPAHVVAWKAVVQAHGADFPEADFYGWGGVPPLKVVDLLNEKYGYTLDPVAVMKDKEARFVAGVHDVQPIASVVAHVAAGFGRIPLAIVSGSPRHSVERTLKTLQLTDKFQVLVCAEDYSKGKPDPEPFLLAAKLLNVEPAKCLVFEDADAGIAAAKAAGMQWVRVPQTFVAPV